MCGINTEDQVSSVAVYGNMTTGFPLFIQNHTKLHKYSTDKIQSIGNQPFPSTKDPVRVSHPFFHSFKQPCSFPGWNYHSALFSDQ